MFHKGIKCFFFFFFLGGGASTFQPLGRTLEVYLPYMTELWNDYAQCNERELKIQPGINLLPVINYLLLLVEMI